MIRVATLAAAAVLLGGCTLTGLSPATSWAMNAGIEATDRAIEHLEE